MHTDPRLVTDVRKMKRGEFMQRYSHPFLGITVVSMPEDGDEGAFDTGVYEMKTTDIDPGLSGEENMLCPVAKRPGANEFSFITIGRAGNNDIVIAANSVSKCHCMLQKSIDGFTLVDAESRNGTSLNGTALTPRKSQPVVSGDVILFARGISAMYLDSGSAYTWLRRTGI